MPLEGNSLGRYLIVRLLGSGGMGEVYLAEDPRIGQQVAIKVVRSELSLYPNTQSAQEAARLFQREARAIGKLDHPHVLPLNDYGEAQVGEMALIYLVMPYRPEGSLVNWIRQHFPDQLVPPTVVAHVVNQAAEALQHAHHHQITHQDVKPSNFLIRTNEKIPTLPDVLLADFGIARIASSTANTSQNSRGTPAYMAPEQILGEAVAASDQYALAVMAYELLTGRLPFQGNAVRLMYQHLHTTPEPPSTHNLSLPRALDNVLLTALSKRPDERFGSMDDFATAFAEVSQIKGVTINAAGISAAELSNVTKALDTLQIIESKAEASTKVTLHTEESMPWSVSIAEKASTPLALDWAVDSTDPTAVLLQETGELGHSKDGDAINSSRPHGWTEETGVPMAPPLPEMFASEGGKPQNKEVAPPTVPLGTHRQKGKHRFKLITAAALVILALVGGGVLSYPRFIRSHAQVNTSSQTNTSGGAASATVTITPASKDLQNNFPLSAVTGTPDSSQKQVGARLLSMNTPASNKTVNTTGQGTTPGTQASGMLVIENELPTGSPPLILNAGSVYPNNGGTPSLNIHIKLDATVTIPASGGSGVGNVFTSGHVVEVGTIGNFPFFDSNADESSFLYYGGCSTCSTWFRIDSYTNFAGGTDPQTYSAVAQSDINNAAQTLESANKPDPQQTLQPQIQSNEQLVGTPQCSPNVSSNHNPGDQASTVTVSVTFTCTGEVYDRDGALTMAANLLTQQAATVPGAGFALVGKIATAIVTAVLGDQNIVTLTVSAEGTWTYQFTDAQKQALTRLIAGKSQKEAQQLLTSQPGVAKASISLSGGIGNTLPADASKITIVVSRA